MRLFAGVWPSPEVCLVLASLERPEVRGVRWMTQDQWHVTLAFLGDVAEDGLPAMEAALEAAAARTEAPPEAQLGPSTHLLGRAVLCVEVGGLEEAADAVGAAFAPLVPGGERAKPFQGHLTLARAKGRGSIPRRLAGSPIRARWLVREYCLVASELGTEGARYTTLARATVPFRAEP